MKTTIMIVHWIPRILGIMAIIFISLFALDSFKPGVPPWQQIAGFLMHMIPSFLLILFLVVAWKWELPGGIMFVILGLGFMPFIYMMNYHMNHSVWMSAGVVLMINLPFVLTGSLFITSHILKNRHRPRE